VHDTGQLVAQGPLLLQRLEVVLLSLEQDVLHQAMRQPEPPPSFALLSFWSAYGT
jgi:hypothetical protein